MKAIKSTKREGLPLTCHMIGPESSHALPSFIYFSLSSHESLELHPYNQPASLLSNEPLRIYSFTLPGHEEGKNKFDAMKVWAEEYTANRSLFDDFLEKAKRSIQQLIDEGEIEASRLAVGGLSRGAFIAAHLSAIEKRISYVLGFAPLTHLPSLKEFRETEVESKLHLNSIAKDLLHLKGLRFYISNHDTRVSTDHCYQFIKTLSDLVAEERIRTCHVELRITHPIGLGGHGTAPDIFEEGSLWLKRMLL